MDKTSKIYIAGATGLVGSALHRKLVKDGYNNILTTYRTELDLTNQRAVMGYMLCHRPEYIFICAAKVGGILANNTKPAEFIHDNLLIQTNLIDAAHCIGVKKTMMLGSSCIYPRDCPQPMNESHLLSNYLERTNAPYAVAKIAGITMAQAYATQYGMNIICPMPTNLYGPNDNYDLLDSHVLAALIRKVHEAKRGFNVQCDQTNSVDDMKANRMTARITLYPSDITIWGSGTPKREFLHVDDLVDALVFLMLNYDRPEIINVGWGEDISINDLLGLIMDAASYHPKVHHDLTKPDGTPRKLLDCSKLFNMGWRPKIGLKEGIKMTYDEYASHHRN